MAFVLYFRLMLKTAGVVVMSNDTSPVHGHWDRWGSGYEDGEWDAMIHRAAWGNGGGFLHLVPLGANANDAFSTAPRPPTFRSTFHQDLSHPCNMLIKATGDRDAVLDEAEVYDRAKAIITGVPSPSATSTCSTASPAPSMALFVDSLIPRVQGSGEAGSDEDKEEDEEEVRPVKGEWPSIRTVKLNRRRELRRCREDEEAGEIIPLQS